MNITQKISEWGDLHHPKILDSIRMLLGIFLLVKGVGFPNIAPYLRYLIIENKAIRQSPEIIRALIDYVTYMHLLGGCPYFSGAFYKTEDLIAVAGCIWRGIFCEYFISLC